MSGVDEHYARLLAPIYAWMLGGPEQAFAAGASDLEGLLPEGSLAVDLGGGFGTHAIPLARRGWTVLSIDSSPELTAGLERHAAGLPVRAISGELLDFGRHLPAGAAAQLILCMGDTLTHLPDRSSVAVLAQRVAASLAKGGRFIATFRDYSRPPEGLGRFIPVRSDEDRILTCFLEAGIDHVTVHDLLHEKRAGQWALTASAYRKLRIAPEEVRGHFAAAGLRASLGAAARGMVRLVADA